MKTLMISTDRSVFSLGSAIRSRLIERTRKKGESLMVIVFAKKSLGFLPMELSPEVGVYPTASLSRWFYVWDAVRLGRQFLRPDLITAQDPFECGLAAWRLARFFRGRLELQIHTDFLSPHFRTHSPLNHLRVFISSFLLPRADHIRVVSNRIKKSLLAKNWHLKADIEVRPIAVDIQKIQTAPVVVDLKKKYPQFKKIILMASRLAPEKNFDLAQEAMAKLVKKWPEVGLVIVGAGPELENLKFQVTRLRLQANVIFEPWIEKQTLWSYAKTADLFLLTSWYEGYGVALVEAQAAGCPIVSTDVGVAREIGATIAPFDAPALASLIVDKLKP